MPRSPGICFSAEENSGKPQLGDRRRRLCNQTSPQIVSLNSKWGLWNRTARQECKRKERRKGRGRVDLHLKNYLMAKYNGACVSYVLKTTMVGVWNNDIKNFLISIHSLVNALWDLSFLTVFLQKTNFWCVFSIFNITGYITIKRVYAKFSNNRMRCKLKTRKTMHTIKNFCTLPGIKSDTAATLSDGE